MSPHHKQGISTTDQDHEMSDQIKPESNSDNQPLIPNLRKRKAEDTLSTNPYTVKARNRAAKLDNDPLRGQIEKAKNADQGAITYAKKKLLRTSKYLNATPNKKLEMIQESKDLVLLKRERDGADWKSLAKSLGWGMYGGLYSVVDDGNPVWEDIDYESENEYEFEMRWRQDEKLNKDGEVTSNKDSATLKKEGYKRQQAILLEQKTLQFRTWQNKWRHDKKSFFAKNKLLSFKGTEGMLKADYLRSYPTSVACFQKGPKAYFTQGEKAIWRNLAAWAFPGHQVWIDLPGPASWWEINGKDIDIDKAGFYFSDQITGHRQAMEMVLAKNLPEDNLFDFIFPSGSDLRVMKNDSQSRMALQAYYSIGRHA